MRIKSSNCLIPSESAKIYDSLAVKSNKGKSKLYQNNPCVPRTRRGKRTIKVLNAPRVTSGTWCANLLYKRGNIGNKRNR